MADLQLGTTIGGKPVARLGDGFTGTTGTFSGAVTVGGNLTASGTNHLVSGQLHLSGDFAAAGQLTLGRSGHSGRLSFRRGMDGTTTAFIGYAGTGSSGGDFIVHAAGGDGAMSFIVGSSTAALSLANNGAATFVGDVTLGTNGFLKWDNANYLTKLASGNVELASSTGVNIKLDANNDDTTSTFRILNGGGSPVLTVDEDGDITMGMASRGFNANNANFTSMGSIQFADPGPGEGLEWAGGSGWKLYESPDDLTTNSGGNLQFVVGSTRAMTITTGGNIQLPGTRKIQIGPNAEYSKSLIIGSGTHSGLASNGGASVIATNNNLHLDAEATGNLYLNYYSGTGGIFFGNGASGTSSIMNASGSLSLGNGATGPATGYRLDVNGNTLVRGNIVAGSQTSTTDTIVKALTDGSHKAGFEAYGTDQGNGYMYVGQDHNYGGGFAYNGGGAGGLAITNNLPDRVSFFRRNSGTNYEVFCYSYLTETVTFRGAIVPAGVFSNGTVAAGSNVSGTDGNFLQDCAQAGWVDVLQVKRAGSLIWTLQNDVGAAKFTGELKAAQPSDLGQASAVGKVPVLGADGKLPKEAMGAAGAERVNTIALLKAKTGMDENSQALVPGYGLYLFEPSSAELSDDEQIVDAGDASGQWFLQSTHTDAITAYTEPEFSKIHDILGPVTRMIKGTFTWNPASAAAGNGSSIDITVEGAEVGAFVGISAPVDIFTTNGNLILHGCVIAANVVRVVISNQFTTTVDFPEATFNLVVINI